MDRNEDCSHYQVYISYLKTVSEKILILKRRLKLLKVCLVKEVTPGEKSLEELRKGAHTLEEINNRETMKKEERKIRI